MLKMLIVAYDAWTRTWEGTMTQHRLRDMANPKQKIWDMMT